MGYGVLASLCRTPGEPLTPFPGETRRAAFGIGFIWDLRDARSGERSGMSRESLGTSRESLGMSRELCGDSGIRPPALREALSALTAHLEERKQQS